MIQLSKKKASRTFNDRFYIKKRISAGSFGVVFLCNDLVNQGYAALKVEKDEGDNIMSLERERQILEKLQGIQGIPIFLWHGYEHGHNCIALQLLGKDLSYHLRQNRKFSIKTVCNIADQLLNLIEQVHKRQISKDIYKNRGVVHRDIKPENIITGRDSEQNILYLVDYGISKQYTNTDGSHLAFKEGRPFTGTTRYASIAAHNGQELSRRDDLESLGYVFIFMLKGTLPWQNIQSNNDKEKTKLVGQSKQFTDHEVLCKDIPNEFKRFFCHQYSERYFDYVKRLRFEDLPDYKHLTQIIQKVALTNGFMIDKKFDWLEQQSTSNQSNDTLRHNSKKFSNSKIQSSISNKQLGERKENIMNQKKGTNMDHSELSDFNSQGGFLKLSRRKKLTNKNRSNLLNNNEDIQQEADSNQSSVFLNNYVPSRKEVKCSSYLQSIQRRETLQQDLEKKNKEQIISLHLIQVVPQQEDDFLMSHKLDQNNLFNQQSQNFQDLEALQDMIQVGNPINPRSFKTVQEVKKQDYLINNTQNEVTQTINLDDLCDDGPELSEKLKSLSLSNTIFQKTRNN